MTRSARAQRMTRCALFAALIALCAQIQIPLPGVPINLSLFAVLLAALLLPQGEALFSILAYLTLGTFGIPVFTGLRAGPSVLLGPTGGFLVGYLPAAALAGRVHRRLGRPFPAALCGAAACMLCGIAGFALATGAERSSAFFLVWLAYVPGDLAKAYLAALLCPKLDKAIRMP